jgi:hypothetical protein
MLILLFLDINIATSIILLPDRAERAPAVVLVFMASQAARQFRCIYARCETGIAHSV